MVLTSGSSLRRICSRSRMVGIERLVGVLEWSGAELRLSMCRGREKLAGVSVDVARVNATCLRVRCSALARHAVSGGQCWLISTRLSSPSSFTSPPSPLPSAYCESFLLHAPYPPHTQPPSQRQPWQVRSADMVGEKRKRSSTVHVRSHSAVKRQSTTPAPIPTPPPPEPEVPTSFSRDEPLPVLPERQPDDLPLREYKSVAERFEPVTPVCTLR